jgi:pimeloyl-ACP methyl ester carboxylesterase
MLANAAPSAQPMPSELVIALHCSGSGAGQWRSLAKALGPDYEMVAPEHYGCETAGPWTGSHVFTLADEAARTIALIDSTDRKVHLVGHSYGGGIALHIAVRRPDRIASLALYEPSAFHLLKAKGTAEATALAETALAEIEAITRETGNGIVTGDYRGAAARFVDYWGGPGTWAAMLPSARKALVRWAPKAPLDFAALLGDTTPLSDYAELRCPILILRGERAPAPTRVIAETLCRHLPTARLVVVEGAGHMGPLTDPGRVNAAIVRHLTAKETLNPTSPGAFRGRPQPGHRG